MKLITLITLVLSCTLYAEEKKESVEQLDILEALKIAMAHIPEGKEIESIKKITVNEVTYYYYASYGSEIIPYDSKELQADGSYKEITKYKDAEVGVLISQTGEVETGATAPRRSISRRVIFSQ